MFVVYPAWFEEVVVFAWDVGGVEGAVVADSYFSEDGGVEAFHLWCSEAFDPDIKEVFESFFGFAEFLFCFFFVHVAVVGVVFVAVECDFVSLCCDFFKER